MGSLPSDCSFFSLRAAVCPSRLGPWGLPTAPDVALLKALWILLDGTWDIFKKYLEDAGGVDRTGPGTMIQVCNSWMELRAYGSHVSFKHPMRRSDTPELPKFLH